MEFVKHANTQPMKMVQEFVSTKKNLDGGECSSNGDLESRGGNKGQGEDGKALKSGGGGTNSSTTGSLSSGTGDRQENAKKDSSEKDYEGAFLLNNVIKRRRRSISAEKTIFRHDSASSANC